MNHSGMQMRTEKNTVAVARLRHGKACQLTSASHERHMYQVDSSTPCLFFLEGKLEGGLLWVL